jgi:hypothetical protein
MIDQHSGTPAHEPRRISPSGGVVRLAPPRLDGSTGGDDAATATADTTIPRLILLGVPALLHEGQAIAFRTRKALALLCYLAASPGPHPRERLLTMLVTPATLLRWQRDLIRRKWTVRRQPRGGRPLLAADLTALLARLARENPRWGYKRIQGELCKLGHRVGRPTVRDVLKREHLPPAPQRYLRGTFWRSFCRLYREQVLACDVFVVETALLRTIYVLFFLEVRHLQRVLVEYISFCNERRPHQGLEQPCPVPLTRSPGTGPVCRRSLLGGVVHAYYRAVA